MPYVTKNNKVEFLTLIQKDPGSRYKTRQLQVRLYGQTKMIKTVLVNIKKVAKDMKVPPEWIGQYLSLNMGTQFKINGNEMYLFGRQDTLEMSKVISNFIVEVLLCQRCHLPELSIYVKKKKILISCRSCGLNEEMKIKNDKFKKFIIGHPCALMDGFEKVKVEEKDENESDGEPDLTEKEKKELLEIRDESSLSGWTSIDE